MSYSYSENVLVQGAAADDCGSARRAAGNPKRGRERHDGFDDLVHRRKEKCVNEAEYSPKRRDLQLAYSLIASR